MGKSTWTSFYIQLFFCHIHPDFIRSLQIHRALHTGDVTKRARNLVGDWMGSKGGREERGAKNVHKGVCSIKHEQWFIYVFFRRPSAAQKEELQWIDLLVCVCVCECFCDIDELMKHEGTMEGDIEYQKTCNMDMDTLMLYFCVLVLRVLEYLEYIFRK